MIKVWCEECKGKGIIERNGHYLQECTNCNGKGYTEHEGELSDLELAAVVRWTNTVIPNFFAIDNIIELYKEQKRGTE